MTVSEGHPHRADDPQASLRLELLGQIASAQFELERAATELMGSGAGGSTLFENQAQRSQLDAMMRKVSSADTGSLPALKAEIAQAIATSRATAGESQRAASGEAPEVIFHAAELRHTIEQTMANLHRFDPYLDFASPEAKAEYRDREAERRTYIDAQLAENSLEGTLNASAAAMGQMADAGAHGAAQSPEWQREWDALTTKTERLRDEIRANGGDVAEFDRRLRDEVRQIMRAQGKSDAEIDAHLASHPDPIDAARGVVRDQGERSAVETTLANYRADETSIEATHAPAPEGDLADAIAQFQSAGISLPEEGEGHGLTASRPPPSSGRERG